MTKTSKRRYPPEDIDLSEHINLADLASELEAIKSRWEGVTELDRLGQAAALLRAIRRMKSPDVADPAASEYYEQWLPDDIAEPDIPDKGNCRELQGSITLDEFNRLTRTSSFSTSSSNLRPALGQVEWAITQYVLPAFQRSLREVYEEPGYLAAPFRSLVTGRVAALRFLEWFYGELVDNPEVVPSEDAMAEELVSAASNSLSRERRPPFEFGKRLTLDAVALGIIRSLTGGSQDRALEAEAYYMIADELDQITGLDDYDPLSEPVLGLLVDRIVEVLKQEHYGGIGAYHPWRLAQLFTPRELVALEACARHWRDRDEWPWEEVLNETGLGWAFNEQMLKDTAVKVRDKLEEYSDLRIALRIPKNFGDW